MNIIEQLQLLVKTGSHTEQTISRYILATLSGAEKLTSTAISKKTQTSQPSIVRFAQALGYTGFTSFKYDLIKCLRSEPAVLLPAQATKNNVILSEFINNNNPAAVLILSLKLSASQPQPLFLSLPGTRLFTQ